MCYRQPKPTRLEVPLLSGYTLACFNTALRFNRVRMAVTHFARVLDPYLGLLHRRVNRPPLSTGKARHIFVGAPGSRALDRAIR